MIHSGSEADLIFLSHILRSGGLVAVPTETVYGLAAHALDASACEAIFRAKGRPTHDPLIVHVADIAGATALAHLNEVALRLAHRFWPGPLTFILPKKPIVPSIVTSGRDTVAIRVPAHPLLRALLARCKLPLAAPSANPFGYISPTTAAHVQANLGERIAHILDGGPCAIGLESTIVDVRDPKDAVILRPGGIPQADLAAALGRPVRIHQRMATPSPAEPKGELAPGMLDRHYSPRTPLVLRERAFSLEELLTPSPKVARVCFSQPPPGAAADVLHLTSEGSTEEAARRLFALLRWLDGGAFARIEMEPAPPTGLGPAINDRLRRAACQSQQMPRPTPG